MSWLRVADSMSRLGGIDQRCTAAVLPLQKRCGLMDRLQGPHHWGKAREHSIPRDTGTAPWLWTGTIPSLEILPVSRSKWRYSFCYCPDALRSIFSSWIPIWVWKQRTGITSLLWRHILCDSHHGSHSPVGDSSPLTVKGRWRGTLTVLCFDMGKTGSLWLRLSHHYTSQEAGVFSGASHCLPGLEGIWGFFFFSFSPEELSPLKITSCLCASNLCISWA